MKVIVDTCVWSLALRRKRPKESSYLKELSELIQESRVQLLGAIRHELLLGLKHHNQFLKLRDHLSAFPDLKLESQDYERAAEMFDISRCRGVQGSNIDFLICAVSERRHMPILTDDGDFKQFSRLLKIKLHHPRVL